MDTQISDDAREFLREAARKGGKAMWEKRRKNGTAGEHIRKMQKALKAKRLKDKRTRRRKTS